MQFTIPIPAIQKSVRELNVSVVLLLLAWLSSCAMVEPRPQRWDPLTAPDTTSELGINRSIETASPALSALIQQADQAIEQQQWSAALVSLERAQRIDSKQSAIWTRLAIVYLAKQDPEQAIQMARKSNSHAQHDQAIQAYNWLLMSRAYLQLNQVDQAKAATEKSQQYLTK